MNKKRRLSDSNLNALLLELNKITEDVAVKTAKSIMDKSRNIEIVYPPNTKLTEKELKAIEQIRSIENIQSALEKIIKDSISYSTFQFLGIIDGVGDPTYDGWSGVSLLDKDPENDEEGDMLHDEYFSKYWDYLKTKKA